MSFLEKIKTSKGHLVYLVRGKDKGLPCWHYVLIDQFKLPIFKEDLKKPTIDVADYGEVLESGWGENPPEDVVDRIKKKYT